MGLELLAIVLVWLPFSQVFIAPIYALMEEGRIAPLIVLIVILGLSALCVFWRRIPVFSISPKMRKIIKTVSLAALLGLLVLCVCGRGWIPGLYYPAKAFRFSPMEDNKVSPLSILVDERTSNSSENMFYVKTLTDRKYKALRIRKVSYEWEKNTGEFLKDGKDIEFKLYLGKSSSKDGWYENGSFTYFGRFNPEKLFKGKKKGDKFKFYLTVVYSFDDEPENTVTLEYDADVRSGEYWSSPLSF